MNPVRRYKRYADAVLILMVGGAIWFHQLAFSVSRLGEPFDTLVTALGVVITYELTMSLIEWAAARSDLFLKFYWGSDFLNGVWFYTSENSEDRKNLGVWRIRQDFFGTSFSGFRLDERFRRRSDVHSITEFELREGKYEVVSKRVDQDIGPSEFLSRHSLVPDTPVRQGVFSYPIRMRGETELVGGAKSGVISSNAVFTKVPEVGGDQEMIEWLQARFAFDSKEKAWRRLSPPAGHDKD